MMEVGLDALRLGPLVLAWPRLFALVAAVVVLVVAGWLAARVDRGLAGWGWSVVITALLAGRAGYVAGHWAAFAAEPWSIPAVWQGGLSPVAAFAGAVAYGLARFPIRRQVLAQIPLAAGFAVWLLLGAAQSWLSAGAEARLPERSLPTLATEARLAPAGKPVVINLWASWCPPCQREMPRLAQAASRHSRVAFAFVNQGEKRGEVAAFSERFGLDPGRVFLDPQRRLARDFGTVGLPATLFFDDSGRLVDAHVGEISRAALSDQLDRLNRR